MNARKQWLMDEETLEKFKITRNKMYPLSLANIDHNLLTQYYLSALVIFFRKRREHTKNIFSV